MSDLFETRYKALNQAQKEAVDTIDGPVMVIAGPGSGKTELLSLRVGAILRQTHVSPHNILCLTFTDNGAANMRERLLRLIGPDAYRVSIFTFHAFCNHIIGRYPEYFHDAATFSQATDIVRTEIFESIFKSLPHKHPLASFHPEEGFVYMRDTIDRIKHIKSYGYTASEYETVIRELFKEHGKIDAALASWPDRLSIKNLAAVEQIAGELDALKGTTSAFLAKTLRRAKEEAEIAGKTEALGDWKAKYAVKDDTSIRFRDSYNEDKLRAVAEIYTTYSATMHDRGLYDYDDMIIEVAHTLRDNAVLRNALEEQYEYIMIDEFQDTNEAQMSLVRAITQSAVHEGRPNVCVVGDDDQAIYKFQGAEVSHIMHFRDKAYKDVRTIVLDKNYRSTKEVLALARHIITQGKNRLESRYEDISKVLSAMNTSLPESDIHLHHFASDVEEYSYIARKLREKLDTGTAGDDIAVLARGHRELQALLPYLNRERIPYEYVKRANVFDEPHVKILIQVCRYISSVVRTEGTEEDLLPELLSHPCFGINRVELFRLAVDAKEHHRTWTQAIQESRHAKVASLGKLLAELAVEGKTAPLEHVIEAFIKGSGFKEFYFPREDIKDHPTRYVSFLASLKAFIEALREWKDGEQLYVSDVAPFVQMHEDHSISLVSESPFMRSEHAVQLMTAHASKGLEFGCVFIIAAHDRLWTKPQRVNKAPLPSVLVPLMQPAGDTEDDFIRLLYVAVTRAKHTLFLSGHDELIRYVPSERDEPDYKDIPIEAHENALSILAEPFEEDEWVLMKRLVKEYRMPVTHMNNFLHVPEGGPLYFIEQNLLRFPQPMNASGVYGSAMHKAIEGIVMYPNYHAGDHAPMHHVLATFTQELARGRLPDHEERKQKERGEKVIRSLYEEIKKTWRQNDRVEVDMKEEGVVIGEARLTGKIDFLRETERGFEVYDFKTGKSFSLWDEAKSQPDKIKLHKYRQQLLVYKLLLEHSIRFKDGNVDKLALWFVEESPVIELALDVHESELERTRKLIEVVYRKICALDFPDTSAYPETLDGIIQFEDDLIAGRI
jgi:DNA helicase-2/ATP-dependent DNA helicase PcrA